MSRINKIKQNIDFKDGVNNLDLLFISPWLAIILMDISLFAYDRGLPFKLTSIIRTAEQDRILGASSKTHQQGRAFDFSIVEWSVSEINDLISYLNKKYKGYGAISAKDGKERLIIVHDIGNGEHAHVQVRPMNKYNNLME